MRSTRGYRMWVLLVAVVFMAAGCGGDDSGGGPTTTSTAEAAQPSDDQPEPTAEPNPGDTTDDSAEDDQADDTTSDATPEDATDTDDSASSSDGQTAVVTVGDMRYEFAVAAHLAGTCDPDFFGAYWMVAATTDGSGGGLEILIVPDGNANHDETSKIKVAVKDIDGRDWRADEDGGEGTPAGESRVESFNIDGNTVTGTASFVDIYAGDGATAEGTFEAICA